MERSCCFSNTFAPHERRQGSKTIVSGLWYAKDMHSIRSSKKVKTEKQKQWAAALRTPNAFPSKCKHAESRMASTALGLANLSAQCVELILPKPKQDNWYDLTGSKLQPFSLRKEVTHLANLGTQISGRDGRRDTPEPFLVKSAENVFGLTIQFFGGSQAVLMFDLHSFSWVSSNNLGFYTVIEYPPNSRFKKWTPVEMRVQRLSSR